jgi:predicted transcriptional regulator
MADFNKHAKKILKSFNLEYELNKAEYNNKSEVPSNSLQKKLKSHETKIDPTQQKEDDILGEE